MEAAQIAAITHGHPLGYLPAAVLVYILHRIVYPSECRKTLKEIVIAARDKISEWFSREKYIAELNNAINLALKLAENNHDDAHNINLLGEGWTAHETLAIAIYCSLRHQDDFSKGIIAAVSHKGDSDSTGAVTGNILGAWIGFDKIEDKWKWDLDLYDVIKELTDDMLRSLSKDKKGLS